MLSFAVTFINHKSNIHVGIDLHQDCFSHRDMSRCQDKRRENPYILLSQENKTKYIIYSEVLYNIFSLKHLDCDYNNRN